MIASVRKAQELPHGRAKSAPASSKGDPLLTREKATSNAGWTPVRADLKRKKKTNCCATTGREE